MIKQCLLTGASGLIGAETLKQFSEDWQVFGVSRHSAIPLDLSAPWEEEALPPSVDAVVHLAQSENFRNFPEAAESVFSVNTLSTLKLLDYARRVGAKTFVLASSGGVYGFGNKPFSEDASISYGGELGFYLKTKLCSEILAETYSPYMNIIILRFFFVYGPGQKTIMLIPRLVNSVMTGQPIKLQGTDGLRINPTSVEDAARAIVHALSLEKSDTINVGGPEILSLRDIGGIIGNVLGRDPVFEMAPTEQPNDLVADIHKMTTVLGAPTVTFQEGIGRYVQQTYTSVAI